MCSMSLPADGRMKSEVVEQAAMHSTSSKGAGTKALNVAQCVFVHATVQVKAPQNGFSAGSLNSMPGFCPLVELCFLTAALSVQHLSGGALKHNTPNEMWLVSPYGSIFTAWEDVVGKDAKKRSPAAWWGLVSLRPHGGGCVIFTLAWREDLTPTQTPQLTPKGKEKQ